MGSARDEENSETDFTLDSVWISRYLFGVSRTMTRNLGVPIVTLPFCASFSQRHCSHLTCLQRANAISLVQLARPQRCCLCAVIKEERYSLPQQSRGKDRRRSPPPRRRRDNKRISSSGLPARSTYLCCDRPARRRMFHGRYCRCGWVTVKVKRHSI